MLWLLRSTVRVNLLFMQSRRKKKSILILLLHLKLQNCNHSVKSLVKIEMALNYRFHYYPKVQASTGSLTIFPQGSGRGLLYSKFYNEVIHTSNVPDTHVQTTVCSRVSPWLYLLHSVRIYVLRKNKPVNDQYF